MGQRINPGADRSGHGTFPGAERQHIAIHAGTYPLFGGHVLSCPGAALNISCSTVPSILELLHWQFGILTGFQAACQSRQVADMLATHLDDPLNIRFIPLSRSLLPERQKNYDFLIEGRVQYGFSHLNLEQQEIMNLQQSSSIDILYNRRDCHFRPQVADTAISASGGPGSGGDA